MGVRAYSTKAHGHGRFYLGYFNAVTRYQWSRMGSTWPVTLNCNKCNFNFSMHQVSVRAVESEQVALQVTGVHEHVLRHRYSVEPWYNHSDHQVVSCIWREV
jgi:hypothetical protein